MHTRVKLDHQLLAVEGEHTVSGMLEIHAPTAAPVERRPLHLVFVIDRSGSMGGGRLAAAQAAARFLVNRLAPGDQFGLVVFDNDVELLIPLGPVDVAAAEAVISRIRVRGSTNLSGGWLKGVEEIGRGAGTDAVRRVLLLTDGHANSGITDPARLATIAGGTKAQTATTTIGFGEGFDEDLLEAIANASDGASYFVETPDDAPAVFQEEFEGLASIVAQNLSVEITATDDVSVLGVLNEYPVTAVPHGLQVQLGDLYGSEVRRVVFQAQVPEVGALGVKRIAQLTIRYVETAGQVAQHEVTMPVTVNLVSADEAAAAAADHEVVEQVTLLQAARARTEASDYADAGDFDAAARVIDEASLRLAALASPRSLEEAAALRDHSEALTAQAYSPTTRKRLKSEAWRMSRGRPTTYKDGRDQHTPRTRGDG